MGTPTLIADGLTLRPLAGGDIDALLAIASSPGVREWWGELPDPDKAEEDFNHGTAFTVEVEGEVAGWLGVTEEDEPDYRHAALDIMLAPPHQGRGLGPEALRTAIRWLIDERGHHRFTIDPSRDNAWAIRAYESVGFRPVGVLRNYERGPDGAWRDGLLMDLLAEELAE